MRISGLVLVFEPETTLIQTALLAIKKAGPFIVGELVGQRLSVVMEVATPDDSMHWHRWLGELPGILDVNVAYVSVAEEGPVIVAQGVPS